MEVPRRKEEKEKTWIGMAFKKTRGGFVQSWEGRLFSTLDSAVKSL